MSSVRSLLHPGFAKAGSTFLQQWFQRNPQLRFTAHSIGGYANVFQLADDAHRRISKDYKYFVTSNELLGAGGKIPYGCPLYSFRMLKDVNLRQGQADVCRLLHEMFPESRVVIVTRGFRSIIRSLYSQYIKLGGRRDFDDFLREYRSILVQWLDVDHNLGLYRQAFGAENVLVYPYEALRSTPAAFLTELEAFLGLDHFDHLPPVRNPSLPADRLYWYARLSKYVVTPLAELFSPGTAGKIYSLYGFKVVQVDRLGPAIDALTRIARKETSLEFPNGYLDGFRGLAGSLASDPRYRTLSEEYLFQPADGGHHG